MLKIDARKLQYNLSNAIYIAIMIFILQKYCGGAKHNTLTIRDPKTTTLIRIPHHMWDGDLGMQSCLFGDIAIFESQGILGTVYIHQTG